MDRGLLCGQRHGDDGRWFVEVGAQAECKECDGRAASSNFRRQNQGAKEERREEVSEERACVC